MYLLFVASNLSYLFICSLFIWQWDWSAQSITSLMQTKVSREQGQTLDQNLEWRPRYNPTEGFRSFLDLQHDWPEGWDCSSCSRFWNPIYPPYYSNSMCYACIFVVFQGSCKLILLEVIFIEDYSMLPTLLYEISHFVFFIWVKNVTGSSESIELLHIIYVLRLRMGEEIRQQLILYCQGKIINWPSFFAHTWS